jgi:FMN phosphatase YigB (HAD superfamily)
MTEMKKKITEYKAVVFDLDGTLYYQRILRIKMAWMLGSYYLCHFWRIKELFVVKKFREVREKWVDQDKDGTFLEEKQYRYVPDIMGLTYERVKRTVETWIYDKPLKAVSETADRELLRIIGRLRDGGQKVFVFSDYPIEDKLKALGLTVDGMYAATDERLNELKPSPKGLYLIMEDHGLLAADILMTGDRMSRDGLAAINAGCDYIILPGSKRSRKKLYETMFVI